MTGLARRARSILGLHSGEGGTVALAMGVSFLASAGIMIAQSAIDALFFARYGADRLPVMYLLVGVAMFATTAAVGALLARLGRGLAFLLIFGLISFAALVGRAAILTDESWVYGALWLVYSVAEFIQLLAVWGLAGLVADTRQAKRFFPVISAGSVSGLIVGGAATAPLAKALGSENLLVAWAVLSALAAGLGWRLVRTRAAAALARPPLHARRRTAGLSEGLRDVRHSELLRWVSVGALLTTLMFSLLYLPFSQAAAARYPDPDDLAGFFGVFFALAMGTGLVLSLLVTGRLLARFGVPTVVLVLPLLYLVAFGVLAVAATFATLTLFRFAQVAWTSGGHSSTWEALVNTIPADRRDRVRAFLYGVPKQLGTVLAGVIALVALRLDDERILYAAGLVGATLAVIAIRRVRRAYPSALVSVLREGRPTIFGAPGGPQPAVLEADATSLAVLQELLGDPAPGVRRLAVHALGDLDLAGAGASLLRASEDDDPEVRKTALEALARLDEVAATEAAQRRLADPEPAVRLAALRVLARFGTTPGEALLDDPDVAVRALAAALLLGSAEADRASEVLETVARASEPESRAAAMQAIGVARTPHARGFALNGLRDSAPVVRAEAVHSLARVADPDGVEPLVVALGDPDAAVRETAAAALAELGPGDDAELLVRRFAAESATRALEDDRRLRSLGFDGETLEVLRDSLRARAERHALDAIRAAALLGDRTAVSAALDSLSVSDPAQRANALEVIETVGEPEIVRPLLALWERRDANGHDATALERLRDDPDEWIRTCAERASAAVRGGTMTRTLETLSLVDRVVFLRKVPLFEQLPPQDLQPIAAVAEEHVFSDGETIAAEGEPGDTMYVIVEGQVAVVRADHERLAVRRTGDVIGEMAVISSHPRIASLVAKTPVRVLEIRKPAFEAILRERPEIALATMRVLCERVTARGAQLDE